MEVDRDCGEIPGGQDRCLCFSIVSFACRTIDNSVSVEYSQDTSKIWPHRSLLGVQPVVDFPTGLDLGSLPSCSDDELLPY